MLVKVHPTFPLMVMAAPQMELIESPFFILISALIEVPAQIVLVRYVGATTSTSRSDLICLVERHLPTTRFPGIIPSWPSECFSRHLKDAALG